MLIEAVLKPGTSRKPLGWLAIVGNVAAGVASWYQLRARRAHRIQREHPGRSLQHLLPSADRCGRRRYAARLAGLFRRQRGPRGRILCAGALRRRRHDVDDLLGRAADGLYRPGDFVDLDLHHGRLPQVAGLGLRVLDQVLPARLVRHGVFPVRHCACFWRNRFHQHRRDRCRPGHQRDAAHGLSRAGHDDRRARLQGLGRAVPCVDARCLPGRAGSGGRPDVDRAQGRGVRGAAAHHLLRLPADAASLGRCLCGCSRRSP